MQKRNQLSALLLALGLIASSLANAEATVKADALDGAVPLKLIPIKGSVPPPSIPAPPAPTVEEEVMPGVGMMPGEPSFIRNKAVKAGVDRNEIIYVSVDYTNRISTPFLNPQVIDKSDSDIQIIGQDVYIKPVSVKPIALFITDEMARQTISLTLVPKNIPAQTVAATLENQRPGGEADNTLPSDYQGQTSKLLTQVAEGKTPPGFTASRLPSAVANTGELSVLPQMRYSGSVYDIYKYEVVSRVGVPLELREERFYTDNDIRLIGLYEKTVLNPGDHATLIVLRNKPRKGAD